MHIAIWRCWTWECGRECLSCGRTIGDVPARQHARWQHLRWPGSWEGNYAQVCYFETWTIPSYLLSILRKCMIACWKDWRVMTKLDGILTHFSCDIYLFQGRSDRPVCLSCLARSLIDGRLREWMRNHHLTATCPSVNNVASITTKYNINDCCTVGLQFTQ